MASKGTRYKRDRDIWIMFAVLLNRPANPQSLATLTVVKVTL